ncbi:hypothetical protein PS423_01965 [Pediococcus acidilactici]|uniref:acyltransferase n=1 Tax=Pediococcus acidilactici TaxID=1254 RepID=UPI002F261675
MQSIEKFFDANIKLTKFERNNEDLDDFPDNMNHPIVKFNKVLKEVRNKSKKTKKLADEIAIVKYLKSKLEKLSSEIGLNDQHFQIDTTGKTIIVKDKSGQHYISPTHFEKGAYLSSPHFDHELNYSKNEIPKIHIGKYTRLGKGASINAGANIYIGNYVWLAPGSVLLRQAHNAYGQPAVGSRTIAMTQQPAIYVSDYAWVGREAIVGWDASYIGKASIVGARSFINKWVGDYSIVGDHSKILRYMPYKAYFMEYYKPSLKEILKISD